MSLPRILIDASPLTSGYKNRGIGNQIYSTLWQLLKDKRFKWVVMANGSKQDFLNLLNMSAEAGVNYSFEYHSLPEQNFLGKVSAAIYSRFYYQPTVHKASPDLLITFIPDRGVPKDVPTIVTIPDITPLQTGVFSQKGFLANRIKRQNYQWAISQIDKAKSIVTISEFAKKQIVKHLHVPEDKIAVTHLAVPENFVQSIKLFEQQEKQESNYKRRILNIYNITEPYIIYTGGLEANKNVPQVLRAFSTLVDAFPDLKLVIAGKEFKLGWDHKPNPLNERAEKILGLARELKIAHKVIFTGFIEDQHLPAVLKHASCFVHLSKLEGFGLSALEPQLLSVPVVASDTSTYPEILGNSALLVNPDDTLEVASAISSLITHSNAAQELRQSLTEKGQQNVSRFSWQQTSKKLLDIVSQTLVVEAVGDKAARKKSTDKADVFTVEKGINQKPKAVVLAAYFHPFRGGMELVALDSARLLLAGGYDVTVITSDRKNGNIVVKKEDEHVFPEGTVKIRRLVRGGNNYYFYSLHNLYKTLSEIGPELIHLHGFGFFAHDQAVIRFKLNAGRNKTNLGVVNTPHGPFMAKTEQGARLIFKKFWTFVQKLYLNKMLDLVFAENYEQFDWIKKDYGIKTDKVVLLTPVMPQPVMSYEEKMKLQKKSTGKSGHKVIRIASVTRLSKYKGLQHLVDAFGQLNTAVETKLIIAGATDDFSEDLQRLVRNSPRREDIKVEQDISDERRNQILAEADIFVLGSEWEAFGIVIAEAMSYHCAIISSNTEGARFLIKPGENGLVYNYADLSELTNILNQVILDKKLLTKLQQHSAEILPKFSYEVIKQTYLAELARIRKL